jgi:ribosome-associated protein
MPATADDLLRSGELAFEAFRSSGPGGQNVNKVETAVRLRFDLRRSPSLPEPVKARLARLAGRRVTGDGKLILEAQRFRTQERNRADALARLTGWIARAWEEPKRRRPTRPTAGSRQRRLDEKKRRAALKRRRDRPRGGSEQGAV